MSKIVATSGAQTPIIKGTTKEGDSPAGESGEGLFSALFGGMHPVQKEDDSEAAQTKENITDADLITEPSLLTALGGLGPSKLDQKNDTSNQNTTEDGKTDNVSLEVKKLPDAGLLAADSKLTENVQRLAGTSFLQKEPQMAALAEDLKQSHVTETAAKSASTAQAGQKHQVSELDPEFIGPPPPRIGEKTSIGFLNKEGNNSGRGAKASRQIINLKGDRAHRSVLRVELSPDAQLSTLEDNKILDPNSLKTERLIDVGEQPARSFARSAVPSPQLSKVTVADIQMGFSSVGQYTNSTQNGGQQSGFSSAYGGTSPSDLAEQWLDVLDMQDEKWTSKLIRRIERELGTGAKGLEIELHPRSLGRLKISLSVAMDQTNVVLRTETSSAAQILIEAEGRLSNMLSETGLKLGQFDAFAGGQNHGFERQGKQNEQAGAPGEAERDSKSDDPDTSDGLVNLKA